MLFANGYLDCLALDSESVRDYDQEGRLHITIANISKANVCPYNGTEIPNYQRLGLDANKVYYLLRDPKELEKAAPTANGVPLLWTHKPTDAKDHASELVIGSTGTDASFEEPYLKNSLVIWPQYAVSAVEAEEKKQLSCGYSYDADMTPGVYGGTRYDGIMRNIRFNHVALVAEGRAGPDVVIGDSKENLKMTGKVLSRKAVATLGALVGYLSPRLAQDAKINFYPVLSDLTSENFKDRVPSMVAALKEQTKGKLAQDANIDDVAKLLETLQAIGITEDAAKDDEDKDVKKADKPAAEDAAEEWLKDKLGKDDWDTYNEKKGAKDKKHAKRDKDAEDKKKGAKDADPDDLDPDKKKDKDAEDAKRAKDKAKGKDAPDDFQGKPKDPDMVDKPTMDAAIKKVAEDTESAVVARMNGVREAEKAIRPYVGELAIACDSAQKVYESAFKILKKDVKGIPPEAYHAILEMMPLPGKVPAKKQSIAQDSAAGKSFAERWPTAARITGTA